MMKKWFFLMLVCLMLPALALPVAADVIVEPDDDFYWAHEEECIHQDARQYIVNTELGYAYLYVSPESDRTVRGYSNGDVVSLNWLYTAPDGAMWGMPYTYDGWFRLSDLTLVYDGISFYEEHAEELEPYIEGSYTLEATEEEPIPMWRYPGNPQDRYFEHDDVARYVRETYTDEDGHVWGYITYYMGNRHLWVCLSDPYGGHMGPTNEETTVELKADPVEPAEPAAPDKTPVVSVNGQNVELKAEPTPGDQIPVSAGNARIMTVIGVLVIIVALVTVGVIVVLFVGKKDTEETSEHHSA